MYQATYNQRQQNLAIANQSAQMLQAQAAEDQRIFNNKITGLGFAMKVDDYRTPEQQLQNQLRFNAINNDLQLLNKAKSNDLELYNKYATAKLENQLEYELQDLNVKDPAQLKANLSRVLDSYYKEY
jgi:flagellar biosynthesis regulator FlaF